MPVFYNFTQSGLTYSFDDIFVPADLFREGNLWTWGSASYGRLGTNDTTPNRLTPVTTFSGGNNWKQVSSSSIHTAAIKTDGTLWVWGNNDFLRLGINATGNRSTPITTFAGGTTWKQVSCGGSHTAAIKTDGTLWTWGLGVSGRLGNAVTTNVSTPVTTFAGGTNWKQVSAGGSNTAAIKTDGTLWIWGSGNSGRLGTNDTTTLNRPTPITTFAGGTNWKEVSSGSFINVAIKTDGTLWTWGYGDQGRLGINDTGNRFTPVTTFAGGNNWKQVSAGGVFTAALKTDGTLWTWGSGGGVGGGPALGTNAAGNRSTPVTTFAGGTDWKQVSAGDNNAAAIKTDGTLWVWGYGTNGILGNAVTTNASTPVTTFAGGTNWKQSNSGVALTYIDPVI